MDAPLIGATPAATAFPDKVYENASSEQRTYDQLSYGVLTGQFVVFAFPYALTQNWPASIKLGAFLASAICVIVLFALYLRMAAWANAGRRIMYLIEAQWSVPGFSYNIGHGQPASRLKSILRRLVGLGIFKVLRAVTFTMVALQLSITALLALHLVQ